MGWLGRLDNTERYLYTTAIAWAGVSIVWMVVSILKYGGWVPPNAG